jgi:hypothetical protein
VACDRVLSASQDYTRYGGPNYEKANDSCALANVYSRTSQNLPGTNSPYAAVPSGFSGTQSQQEFAATAGSLNQCSPYGAYYSLVPSSRIEGLLVSGDYCIDGRTSRNRPSRTLSG